MLGCNDWDLRTKTHSCLIFSSVLVTETQNSYMFWHTFFTSFKLLTSIFQIFILHLPSCCKSSPDSSSLRMQVKCIMPAFSLTLLFADAMNCGLLPEITVAWTPKPFPSLKISTKKGILSPAHRISPNLVPGCGMCWFQKARLCYPQSAKLTTAQQTSDKEWGRPVIRTLSPAVISPLARDPK